MVGMRELTWITW